MGPEAMLRLFEGRPRGFWARGGQWVAHGGRLARLADRDLEAGGRFAFMQDAMSELRARPRTTFPERADERLLDRLRVYGGFAFDDDHFPLEIWRGFWPAHFDLPAFELVRDADGSTRLFVRCARPLGSDPDEVRAFLQDTATRMVADLEAKAAGYEPWPEAEVRSEETGRVDWEISVGKALAAIEAGHFSKVVLARTLDLTPDKPLDPVAVVSHLWRENPSAHVFLFEPSAWRTFLGAAPETVATLRGGAFHATAVAGSVAAGETEEERLHLAERLLASAKDLQEHRIACEDMVARLTGLADVVVADGTPHVLSLAGIQHLETTIRARAPGRSVLELLDALHPTPAVCGHPRDAALKFLWREERFDRGWYAGPVGFFDEEGDGVFAPALRCAVTDILTWRLFAGAGIVAGSRAQLEWEETAIKFEPMLRALEASGARIAGRGAGDHEGDEQG